MAEQNQAMAEQILLCSDKLSRHFLTYISPTGNALVINNTTCAYVYVYRLTVCNEMTFSNCIQVAANYLSADSLTRCITFFRRLLSLHPPGQHPLVDMQYSEFVRLLGQEGSPYAIWDSVSTMLR